MHVVDFGLGSDPDNMTERKFTGSFSIVCMGKLKSNQCYPFVKFNFIF